MTRILHLTILLLAIVAQNLCSVHPQALKLGDLMTHEEQKQTGVSRLTSREKAELEVWMTNYTLRLYSNLARNPGLRPGELPLGGQQQTRQSNTEYKPQGQVLKIDEVWDEGQRLRLSDGSVWRVSKESFEIVFKWEIAQRITVYRSRSREFPYRLVNVASGQATDALVEYGPSYPDKNQAEERRDPNLRVVGENIQDGIQLIMEDGSRWEISPWDRFKSKLWLPGESIRVKRSGAIIYPYNLVNTDTEEAAEAKLIKAAPADAGKELPRNGYKDTQSNSF